MTDETTLAIGVDGGASGVRALAVRRRSDGLLEAAGTIERLDHERCRAKPFDLQRAEAADPQIDGAESAAARARRGAAADMIDQAAQDVRRILVGICWPGIKTADGRGVAVMRHGPRDPRLLDELERDLASRGIEVARPIPPLASDGVAGALGEQWSARGGLRGVRNALYFAGGSGLAESLVIDGRVRALRDMPDPMPMAYELSPLHDAMTRVDSVIARFEDVLSPGRWKHSRAYVEPHEIPGIEEERTDWMTVFRRDPRRADDVLLMVSQALVRYIEDRMRRLRQSANIVPERALVGARLGQLLASAELDVSFGGRVRQQLVAAGLPPDFVRASTLIAAPCFGAAALALGLQDESCPS